MHFRPSTRGHFWSYRKRSISIKKDFNPRYMEFGFNILFYLKTTKKKLKILKKFLRIFNYSILIRLIYVLTFGLSFVFMALFSLTIHISIIFPLVNLALLGYE